MYLLIFMVGCILGSFYLVVGKRLPKKEDIITSRSKCDNCNHVLKWYNLIPLFSFIIQKGHCTYCGKKISIDHFLVELITGLLFLFTYIKFPTFGYNFFVGLIIVSLMILIFVSDFNYMIILDSPLIIAGILLILLKIIFFDFKTCLFSIMSAVMMFIVMLLIERLGTILFKKDSLGGGDIKFSLIMGFCLGIRISLVALILSTFIALPYALASLYLMKKHEFAYGPFLAGALFITFFNYDKFVVLLNYLFAF